MSDSAQLLAAARAAYDSNDWGTQERLARQIVLAARREGNARAQARGFHHLGIALYHRNAAEDARAAYLHALELLRREGDRVSAAVMEMSLGSVALDLLADPTEARRYYDMALPVIREGGSDERLGQCLGNLAEIARLEGDYEGALRYAAAAIAPLERAGDRERVGWQYVTMAHCHTLQRRYEMAFQALGRAYEQFAAQKNPRWLAAYFDAWLMAAVHLRKWEVAAQLTGFLERYRHENRVPRLAGLAAWYNVSVEQVQRNLEADRLFEMRMQGADLDERQLNDLVTASVAQP